MLGVEGETKGFAMLRAAEKVGERLHFWENVSKCACKYNYFVRMGKGCNLLNFKLHSLKLYFNYARLSIYDKCKKRLQKVTSFLKIDF